MAMQKKLWSISGLANELEMDRRTMAKRLQGLPAAESRQVGDRTEKRWYLADVLQHLKNPRVFDPVEEMKEIVGQKMFPSLLCSKAFQNILMYGTHEEMGLTKTQAMRVYQFASLALLRAFSEIHEDEDMGFEIPDHIKEMQAQGLDAYAEKHWPN